jgi:hypothetical protein
VGTRPVDDDPTVRRAHVSADHPARAAKRLAEALGRPGDPSDAWAACGGRPSLVVVFASHRLDADAVAAAIDQELAGTPWIGCTSCGEIGAGGDHEGTIAAIAIGSPKLRVGLGIASDLARSALRSSRDAVSAAAASLGLQPEQLQPGKHAAIALVDGRSGFEESFCLGSAATAPQVHFVGGSASDNFEDPPRARVFFGGKAYSGAGVVAVIETDLPFAVIESEHMVPTPDRVVVTAADPERRRVAELDGQPAAKRYAQLVAAHGGGALTAVLASSYPFAMYVGGRPYVRSVAEIDGQTLVFASAVDPGTILRLMRPGDLVGSTRQALLSAASEVGGHLRAVIAFSCLGRHREAMTSGARGALGELYDETPLVGFHSLGEQKGPLLVNHTLTGLAIGGGRA